MKSSYIGRSFFCWKDSSDDYLIKQKDNSDNQLDQEHKSQNEILKMPN